MKVFTQDGNLKSLFFRHPTSVFLATMLLMLVGATLATLGLWTSLGNLQGRADHIQTQQSAVAGRQQLNVLAIEKGCILLNNKIIESRGVAAKSSGILIGEILKLAAKNGDDSMIARYQELASQQQASLKTIDCEFLARHPDKIKALPNSP